MSRKKDKQLVWFMNKNESYLIALINRYEHWFALNIVSKPPHISF